MPELWYAARVSLVRLPLRFTPTIDQDTLPVSYRYAWRNLVAQGFRVYCPYFVHEVISRGEKIRVALALFQGYIFVSFDPVTKAWRSINNTRGVKHLLPMHDEVPIAVPDEFIDRLHQNETLMAADQTVKLFEANEVVRILKGALENQVATVVQSRRELTRVRLHIFGGREVPAIVATRDLIAEQGGEGHT